MTLGAGSFAYVLVMQFRPPSAGTTVFGAAAIAENTTTTLNSGSVSVSGTDLIALGAFAEYTAAGTSNEQLGGVAATGVLHPSWPSLWYRLPTSNFSGAATATLGAADNQLGGVMVLQVAAGGGGGSVDQGAGWNRDMLTGRLPHMRMKEPAGFKRRDRIYVPARLAA